jgi:hypothetical protein
LLYFVHTRDKKVVGVFVRFRAPLQQHNGNTLDVNYIKEDHLVYYSNCDSQEQLAISIHAVAEVKSLKSSKSQIITQRLK